MRTRLLPIFILLQLSLIEAQQVAPDFTLTDIDGQSHQLYDYLDQGKTVILDFYAVWCVPCQDNAAGVESVWEQLGTGGTNQIMILGLESDDSSTDSQVAMYAADWDCSNPQINTTNIVEDLFGLEFYPSYYIVCPDRSFLQYGGDPNTIANVLLDGINGCAEVLNLNTDARIFDYNSSTSLCSENTTPNITLMNMGLNNLTSVDIKVFLNNNLQSTTNWTGNLSRYEFDDVSLPVLPVSMGTNELSVVLENPNNVADQNEANNMITTSLTSSGMSYISDSVKFELYFDNFPNETRWEFLNSQGQIIFSGDDYIGFPNFSPPIDTFLALPPGDCYEFKIYDDYGDGICCGFADPGEGFWRILTLDDEIIAEGGTFEYEESAFFGITLMTSSTQNTYAAKPVVFPNPVNDKLTIDNMPDDFSYSLYSSTGQLCLKGYAEGGQTHVLDLSGLGQEGVYILKMESKKASFVERVMILR